MATSFAAENEKSSLLTALVTIRAATLTAFASQSGAGTASVSGSHVLYDTKHQIVQQDSLPEHKVEFKYSGPLSIWKAYDPGGSPRVNYVKLSTLSRQVTYKMEGPKQNPTPAGVIVDKANYPAILQEPEAWSPSSFSQMPILRGGEDRFATLESEPGASIYRKGNLLILDVDQHIQDNPQGVKSQKEHYEFDMAAGGLLSHMTWESRRVIGGNDRTSATSLTWIWEHKDNSYVPTERSISLKILTDGLESEYVTSKIVFSQFSISSVAVSEFSVPSMGIPDGTHVVDLNYGLDYPYSSSLGDKILRVDSTAAPH